MTTPYLAHDLKHDEGLRLVAYRDTLDVWTIGYGHAHVPPGTTWTEARADEVFASDLAFAEARLDARIPWWRTLPDPIQDVLANMAFNMGWGDGHHGLSSFVRFLASVKAGRYAEAAAHMLESAWAGEVGARAERLAKQMRTGLRVAP